MASVPNILLLSLAALALSAPAPVDAAQSKPKTQKSKPSGGPGVLYRYVDETGAVVVKDYLPPEVVPRGYTITNQSGQVIQVVPPVLSKAEQAEEKKRKALAEAEERARRDAIRRDADLIRNFGSVEDIMRARDTQLSALDVQISIRNGQTKQLTGQLEEMQSHAADYERRGETVPSQLLKDIQESQRQLDDNKRFVSLQDAEKLKVAERFKSDIVRFKELQAQRLLRKREEHGTEGSDGMAAVALCSTADQCRKAWQLAQIYARDNGTRSLEIVTDTLILTGKPVSDKDISIALSRVPDKAQGAQLVLEVSCMNNDAGTALCGSEKVRAISSGFESYLSSRLQ